MDIKHLKKILKHQFDLAAKWAKKRKEQLTFGGIIASSLVVIGVVSFLIFQNPLPSETPVDGDGNQTAPVVFRHPLTGELVPSALTEYPQVFGVMIENSADAWPLAGLDEAFLVIEAPVEADIPRFIAFFSDEHDVDTIGPVRSARLYYLDWNDELDAVYAHVGGSPEALELIAQNGTLDLNEFYQGEYFYRQNHTRYAPHNVYTSSSRLAEAMEELIPAYELQDSPPQYDAWIFKDDEPTNGDPASIDIDWTDGATYDVSWNYQAATNNFVRDQTATTAFLEDGKTVSANNVIVMQTSIITVDEKGRRHLVTIGEGEAIVFRDGKEIEATWKKSSRTERLRFYDVNDDEIAMNAGATWIEVVDDLDRVSTR